MKGSGQKGLTEMTISCRSQAESQKKGGKVEERTQCRGDFWGNLNTVTMVRNAPLENAPRVDEQAEESNGLRF